MVIRRARPDDASIAAYLIRQSLHLDSVADYILGLGDPDLARRALQRFFVKNTNRFSYDHAQIAEVGSVVVGIILGYDARTMRRANYYMAFQAPFVYGLRGAVRLARASGWLMFDIPKPGPGEFHVHNLAVLPEWRGRGIGKALLLSVEERARQRGYTKCSLDVSVDNPDARGFYEHLGYRVTHTSVLRGRLPEHGLRALNRMVKSLERGPVDRSPA